MGKFAPGGPASPSVVSTQNKTTPVIYSITLDATPGVETALVIPGGTVEFKFRAADRSTLKIATTSGNTATDDKWTLIPGNTFEEATLQPDAKTYYIASNKASTVVQIRRWL